MNINIPAALRPFFSDPEVQAYMRDHNPALLDTAERILRDPDEGIASLDILRLACCLGEETNHGDGTGIAWPGMGTPIGSKLAKALAAAHPENVIEGELVDYTVEGKVVGKTVDIGPSAIPGLIANARKQSEVFHAEVSRAS